MEIRKKRKKLYEYCNGKICSECRIDKENQNHKCGGGYDAYSISEEEVNKNYGIVFEEIIQPKTDIKGKKIAVLCDTKEKVKKFYEAFGIKVDSFCFKCIDHKNLHIRMLNTGEVVWNSAGYYERQGYELITFDEFMNGKAEVKVEKEEEKKEVNVKFKVGDRAKVIANTSEHPFDIGDVVELYEKDEIYGDFRARTNKNEKFFNWITTNDLEHLNSLYPSKTLTITTSDTITTLTDGQHTTSINRYYTDKNDEKVAVNEVVKKYYAELDEIERVSRMPKVGDMVKVVDNDRTYSTYYKWFFENKITDECVMNWQYDRYPNNSSRAFRVVAIGKHNRYNVMIALIADDVYTYLINIEGLEVIK